MTTQKRLKELLFFDPETGIFIWRVKPSNPVKRGSVAGHLGVLGYTLIGIDGLVYPAHRLAYLWMMGEFPPHEIDHIDGQRANNKWSNLRPVTKSQNQQNSKMRIDNTSGHKGITWNTDRQKWMARVQIGNKRHYLGIYDDLAQAVQAVKTSRSKLHGEFTRHN